MDAIAAKLMVAKKRSFEDIKIFLRDKEVIIGPDDCHAGTTLENVSTFCLYRTCFDSFYCARMIYVSDEGTKIIKDRYPAEFYPTLQLERVYRKDYLRL